MELWMLRPNGFPNREELDGNWEPWYDKCFGMVIRAETEDEARAIANENADDEDGYTAWNKTKPAGVWTQPEHSTCAPLSLEGDATLIIKDVHRA